MVDSQKRLDRSLKNLLGENSPLIKFYTQEEVVDLLIEARQKERSSIEFSGSVETVAKLRIEKAGFRVETFENAQKIVITVVSW